MKKILSRRFTLIAGLILAFGLLFGTVGISAATLDYSKVNYAESLSVPIVTHPWRIVIPHLNKASSATVTSSKPSIAGATVYNSTLKQGYIYVTPHRQGTTTVKVAFNYNSGSGTVSASYSINLRVYPYSNPLKTAKVGSVNLTPFLKSTNFTTRMKLSRARTLVRMIPNSGWVVKGVYAQGLRKTSSGYTYSTLKIASNKPYDFRSFLIVPDLYVRLYNSSQKMYVNVLLSNG